MRISLSSSSQLSKEYVERVKVEVATIALDTVRGVMSWAEDNGKHTPGSWTSEGALYHLIHAEDHIDNVLMAIEFSTMEEIDHAICRLAMAKWSILNSVLGDNGPEGVNNSHDESN